jgi:hypothetical protein
MATEPEESGVGFREITRDEAWAMLDAETRRRLGISVHEFAQHYHAGEYDDPDDDPFIMRIAFDLEFLERNTAAAS